MSSEDLDYYRQRAAVERERAKSSSRADIAEIHEELARLYDALIEHEALRPTGKPGRPMLRIASSAGSDVGHPRD